MNEKPAAPSGTTEPRHKHRWAVTRHLRGYFLAGVLVTAPVGITFYVVWHIVAWFDQEITPLIPTAYNPQTYLPFHVPGIGLVVAFIALYLIGGLTAGLTGRFLVHTGERLVARMPVVRGLYSTTKQIFQTVLAKQSSAFREVVLFEYPRKGIWTIGFITAQPVDEILDHTGEDLVDVFVPTTPVPTAGFLLFVPRKDLKVLNMTVEEGIKLVVSVGIVTPPERQTVELRELQRLRAASSRGGERIG